MRSRVVRAAVAAVLVGVISAVSVPASAAPVSTPELGRPVRFAGVDESGFSGDGGPASEARFGTILATVVGPDGTVYIADSTNHRVRAVSPAGIVTTVAGGGKLVFSRRVDGDESEYVTVHGVVRATEAALASPSALAMGPDGTLYVADSQLFQVLALSPSGQLRPVAGNGRIGFSGDGGLATRAAFGDRLSLAVSRDGVLYISDSDNYCVRAVSADGRVTTIAGRGSLRVADVNPPVPARDVGLHVPTFITVDPAGKVWFNAGDIVFAGTVLTLHDGELDTILSYGPRLLNDYRSRWTTGEFSRRPTSLGTPPSQEIGVPHGAIISTVDDQVFLYDNLTSSLMSFDTKGHIGIATYLHDLYDIDDRYGSYSMSVGRNGVLYYSDTAHRNVISAISIDLKAAAAAVTRTTTTAGSLGAAGLSIGSGGLLLIVGAMGAGLAGWWIVARRRRRRLSTISVGATEKEW